MSQPVEETNSPVDEHIEAENGRRLIAACDNNHVAARRAELARASRPARRIVMIPVD